MSILIDLHKLTAEISARLVRSTAESLDEDITQSLAEVIPALNADRGGLVSVGNGSPLAHVAHVCYADGIKEVARDINLVEHFPWAYQTMVVQQRIVSITSLSDFPPEAEIDKRSHEAIGTRSILSVPLMIGQRVHHILVLHAVKTEQYWLEEVVAQIRLIGEIFVSALQRRESELILKDTRDRLELAARSAGCGMWELDFESGVFWITPTVRGHFGFAPDQPVTMKEVLARIDPVDHLPVLAQIEEARRTGEEITFKYRLRNNGNGIRWLISRGRVAEVGPERKKLLVGVTLDITQSMEMEQRLQDKVREIEELKRQLERENEFLRKEAGVIIEQGEVLGSSAKMREVMTQIVQVARTGSTVLLQGETGTGKGLIAQTIHRLSDRGNRPMVKVNCAALPGALVESELFGREKGAFTGALSKQRGRFELAHGSTLFLDEITEMSLETQAKLLRVLQDGEFERLGSPQTIKVDVRVVAATNRNLEEEIEHGRFRRDLYYRLSIFPITVPPLRERPEDIPQLVWEFVSEFGERMGKKIRRITSRDMEILQTYAWPGNVRELRNVIEHSLIVSSGETLQLQRLASSHLTIERGRSLEDVERQYILSVLKSTRNRIKGPRGAAEVLQMKPSTLYSRMRKLGIILERT
ncbi:MAG: sigma 54-interacting transcriptional regulator [Desulfovibrionales bacterium]|nr:sigma 54-interacting transcriptional regulator [Desulfovibrionales bacterium]